MDDFAGEFEVAMAFAGLTPDLDDDVMEVLYQVRDSAHARGFQAGRKHWLSELGGKLAVALTAVAVLFLPIMAVGVCGMWWPPALGLGGGIILGSAFTSMAVS